MNLLWFVGCLLHIQSLDARSFFSADSVKNKKLPVDCSRFNSDNEILSSLSPKPGDNPSITAPSRIVQWNKDQTVHSLTIFGHKSLRTSIFCLKSLERLTLENSNFYGHSFYGNSIRQFPADIRHLALSLKHLTIRNTHITHLPTEIGHLKRLISLVVSNTDLRSLPDTIGELVYLKNLDVRGNQLSSLPATLQNILNLEQIDVSNNSRLRSLQPLNGHPSLESLKADDCAIEHLPTGLPMLDLLWMANNKLKNLDGINTLGTKAKKRKQFQFQNNFIESVPNSIQFVDNLSSLNLNHNDLRALPEDIYKVTTLTYLHIGSNSFSEKELQRIVEKFKRTNPTLILKLN